MNLKKVRNIFLYLFVIGFFLYPIFQTILIGVAFFLTFFTGEFKNFKQIMFKNKPALILISLFFFYLLSMLYTANVAEGWKGIELKFTMLALPLFLPVIIAENKKLIDNLLKSFLAGAFFYVVFSLIVAFVNYYHTGELRYFFYTDLGFGFPESEPNIHPTYASVFYNIAIFYSVHSLINKRKTQRITLLYILLITVFIIFILLLSSKFGVIILGVNIFLLFAYNALKTKKIILNVLLFLVAFSLFSLLIFNVSILNNRISGSINELTQVDNNSQEKQKYQSTGIRIKVWSTTLKLIAENPVLGVGVGDLRDELIVKYREENIVKFEKQRYDSHQQYLQVFATLGFLGGMLFLLLFVMLLLRSYRCKDSLFFTFLLFFFLFGLIESMLERQAGLVFFCFFGILLYYNKSSKIKPNLD